MIAAITKESKTKEREQVKRLAIERKWKEKKSRGKGKILEGTTLDTSSPQSPGFSVWQPPSPTATSDLYIIIASLKPALQSLARECQTGDEPCVPTTVYSLRMTYRVPAYNKRMRKLLHHTVLFNLFILRGWLMRSVPIWKQTWVWLCLCLCTVSS